MVVLTMIKRILSGVRDGVGALTPLLHWVPSLSLHQYKPNRGNKAMSHLQVMNYGYIRATQDGRYSVYDTIEVLADKRNPRETFKRMCDEFPSCCHAQVTTSNFPAPVNVQHSFANKEDILYIIGLLPGAVGRAYREDAAKVMLEKLEGRESSQPEPPQPEQPQPGPSVNNAPSINQITEAVQAVLNIAGIHPNLIAGVTANAIGKQYPQLAPVMEEAKKALPIPVSDKLLTPSELAEIYARTYWRIR